MNHNGRTVQQPQQCAAILFCNSYDGRQCPDPVERDGLCWTHAHTVNLGMATRAEVLAGVRRFNSSNRRPPGRTNVP